MAEAHFIKHCEKITVIQYHKKSPHNFPATKLKDMKYYHLTERIQNSCYEEIQQAIRKLRKAIQKNSGIILMNRRSKFLKKLKLYKRTKQKFWSQQTQETKWRMHLKALEIKQTVRERPAIWRTGMRNDSGERGRMSILKREETL